MAAVHSVLVAVNSPWLLPTHYTLTHYTLTHYTLTHYAGWFSILVWFYLSVASHYQLLQG